MTITGSAKQWSIQVPDKTTATLSSFSCFAELGAGDRFIAAASYTIILEDISRFISMIRPWHRKYYRQIADCRVFTVNESVSISPEDNSEHRFYVLGSPDWVNVVPITPAKEVVCIRQYRHGSEEITLEIPGGLVDPGEAPREAAARECLEETGYKVNELISLGRLRPNPALMGNSVHTFMAQGVTQIAQVDNGLTEHTEVELIPLSRIHDLLVAGEIDHALITSTLWRMLYTMNQ
ncbi:MAG: NUDIX hydrolase [Pseudomonadales bacterium]